jgi:hypothetical protein
MNTQQRFDFDPILEKVSHHIPDEEINLLFPFKKFNIQGRSRKFKTSQLYRAHLLAMLKGIHSFNKLCAEFKTRRAFRDFCLFRNKKVTPTKRMLSEFRDHLTPSGFEKIAQLRASNFLNVVPLPEVKVTIPDATDMPANCGGFAKKNASVLGNANAQRNTQPREQQKARGQRRVDRALILSDIRSIPYASG